MIQKIKQFARQMKLNLKALYLASRDQRTPLFAKILIIIIVAYALSPIDLIPDFIPILGYLDDLILLPIGICWVINLLPKDLWQELIQQAESSPFVLPSNKLAGIFIFSLWSILIFTIIYYLYLL
tara:strand:- start:638 stop:1012 length:375 start_codon:yes stop_codon:yes gene_type:complete